ncbi:transposase [Bradyrhizobium sp. 1AS20L]
MAATALAIEAFASSMETFRSGRDIAAWLRLVPRQHSSCDKQRVPGANGRPSGHNAARASSVKP